MCNVYSIDRVFFMKKTETYTRPQILEPDFVGFLFVRFLFCLKIYHHWDTFRTDIIQLI